MLQILLLLIFCLLKETKGGTCTVSERIKGTRYSFGFQSGYEDCQWVSIIPPEHGLTLSVNPVTPQLSIAGSCRIMVFNQSSVSIKPTLRGVTLGTCVPEQVSNWNLTICKISNPNELNENSIYVNGATYNATIVTASVNNPFVPKNPIGLVKLYNGNSVSVAGYGQFECSFDIASRIQLADTLSAESCTFPNGQPSMSCEYISDFGDRFKAKMQNSIELDLEYTNYPIIDQIVFYASIGAVSVVMLNHAFQALYFMIVFISIWAIPTEAHTFFDTNLSNFEWINQFDAPQRSTFAVATNVSHHRIMEWVYQAPSGDIYNTIILTKELIYNVNRWDVGQEISMSPYGSVRLDTCCELADSCSTSCTLSTMHYSHRLKSDSQHGIEPHSIHDIKFRLIVTKGPLSWVTDTNLLNWNTRRLPFDFVLKPRLLDVLKPPVYTGPSAFPSTFDTAHRHRLGAVVPLINRGSDYVGLVSCGGGTYFHSCATSLTCLYRQPCGDGSSLATEGSLTYLGLSVPLTSAYWATAYAVNRTIDSSAADEWGGSYMTNMPHDNGILSSSKPLIRDISIEITPLPTKKFCGMDGYSFGSYQKGKAVWASFACLHNYSIPTTGLMAAVSHSGRIRYALVKTGFSNHIKFIDMNASRTNFILIHKNEGNLQFELLGATNVYKMPVSPSVQSLKTNARRGHKASQLGFFDSIVDTVTNINPVSTAETAIDTVTDLGNTIADTLDPRAYLEQLANLISAEIQDKFEHVVSSLESTAYTTVDSMGLKVLQSVGSLMDDLPPEIFQMAKIFDYIFSGKMFRQLVNFLGAFFIKMFTLLVLTLAIVVWMVWWLWHGFPLIFSRSLGPEYFLFKSSIFGYKTFLGMAALEITFFFFGTTKEIRIVAFSGCVFSCVILLLWVLGKVKRLVTKSKISDERKIIILMMCYDLMTIWQDMIFGIWASMRRSSAEQSTTVYQVSGYDEIPFMRTYASTWLIDRRVELKKLLDADDAVIARTLVSMMRRSGLIRRYLSSYVCWMFLSTAPAYIYCFPLDTARGKLSSGHFKAHRKEAHLVPRFIQITNPVEEISGSDGLKSSIRRHSTSSRSSSDTHDRMTNWQNNHIEPLDLSFDPTAEKIRRAKKVTLEDDDTLSTVSTII